MSTTKVGIINLALGHIGQRAIQSISESTVQAAAANRVYDSALEDTLRANNWSFAKTIRALVEIADYESIKWTYGYSYPSNCVAIRKILNEATADMEIGEKFEEFYDPDLGVKVILTDADEAYAEFTYLVTDTTIFDGSFITAFSHRLAAVLAVDLNGKEDQARAQIVLFNDRISEAQRQTANERYNPRTQTSSYVSAR